MVSTDIHCLKQKRKQHAQIQKEKENWNVYDLNNIEETTIYRVLSLFKWSISFLFSIEFVIGLSHILLISVR